jgi:3-oxoacyl-[acyl-carrier-protein] synthase-3
LYDKYYKLTSQNIKNLDPGKMDYLALNSKHPRIFQHFVISSSISKIEHMMRSTIAGIGMHLPKNRISNNDLTKVMDTSDEWIEERTGIRERRFATRYEDSTSTMGFEAAKIAIERAGISARDIDFIIFATLSPDYFFPGCGVLLQRMLRTNEIGALDIRNQCSGFVYGLSVADQFIKTGKYKNILLVASEIHSYALDFSTRGRNLSVLFGDGAGAVVLQAGEAENRGLLSTHLHSDGLEAEHLCMMNPGFHAGRFAPEKKASTAFGAVWRNVYHGRIGKKTRLLSLYGRARGF